MDAQVPPSSNAEPKMQHDDVVGSYVHSVLGFMASYGWFLTFGVVLLIIIWSNIEPKFWRWMNRLESDRLSAQIHKDPDAVVQQHESMYLARQKLQAAHDKKSVLHKEKMEKDEEEKRKNKIADWERHLEGKGYRSKSGIKASSEKSSNETKKPKKPKLLNNDFNPLMGSGASGSSYRPSRRGGAAGGG